MLPVSLAVGFSTRTVSSSLVLLLAGAAGFVAGAAAGASSSFIKSVLIDARRFSHQSFSACTCAWTSARRFRKTVFAAISLADWKIVWPQLGASALAFHEVSGREFVKHSAALPPLPRPVTPLPSPFQLSRIFAKDRPLRFLFVAEYCRLASLFGLV